MADVTVMHSVTTSATGLTATDILSAAADQALLSEEPSMMGVKVWTCGASISRARNVRSVDSHIFLERLVVSYYSGR